MRGAFGLAAAVTAGLVAQRAMADPVPLTLGVAADDAGGGGFARTVGAPVGIYSWYAGWAERPEFPPAMADAAVAAGALPMLTWEPWAADGGIDQPAFALARILAGDFNDDIVRFADQVRDWGGVLALRFAHELDAPHYPWSVGVNGNTAEQAVAAWHHVHAIFQARDADAVWVWCVNVHAADTLAYDVLYPGDEVVDWVALDGYNAGTALPWGGWRTPSEVFEASLADLRAVSSRPAVISEVGCAEQGGDKAAWIHDLFGFAVGSGVRGLVWFDYAKEADWRVSSSPAALAAFRAEAAVAGRFGPPPLPERFRSR